MLDILACPLDKNYPLELIELNVKELEKEDKVKEKYHPLNNDENKHMSLTELLKHSNDWLSPSYSSLIRVVSKNLNYSSLNPGSLK